MLVPETPMGVGSKLRRGTGSAVLTVSDLGGVATLRAVGGLASLELDEELGVLARFCLVARRPMHERLLGPR